MLSGPYSSAQRWYNMSILFDHDQILHRISSQNFRNFGQGTLKILQRRFCLPNFLSDFVQKSSCHAFYHVWNHQFRQKMTVSKGRRTNLKLKSTNLKFEIGIFDGKSMFLVSNWSIWVSNSSDDLQKLNYLATQIPWFQNTINCLRRNNLGGHFRVFDCEIHFKPLRQSPHHQDGDNISFNAQKNKMN